MPFLEHNRLGVEGQHAFAYLFERFPSYVQTFCYREVNEMVHQGMNPWVISIRGSEDPRDREIPMDCPVFELPEEKALRHEVDQRRADGQLPWKVRRAIPRHRGEPDSQRMFEAAWLGPLLKSRGIRHVHAHFGGMAARTAWWIRRLYGIPYSFTGHANDIFCSTGFPVSNEDLIRSAVFVVTETDFARRWVEERYPSSRGAVFRVFNGIDPGGYPSRVSRNGSPLILSVGRFVEKKGFCHLIEACRQLRGKGMLFTCEIIGGGPLEGGLRAQIDRDDLGSVVILTGPMDQLQVRKRLAEATIFVLASVVEKDGGSDNLPTVVMEAMTAGVAPVATSVAGIPEMITDGMDGLLVPPADPIALADAMESLLRDTALRDRLGSAAQGTAAEKFDIRKTTLALKHLLARHGQMLLPGGALQKDASLGEAGGSSWWTKLFR